jgi:hypothetical protein
MSSPRLFGPWFEGPSWDPWKTILRAAYALPMSTSEKAFLREVAERDPPERQVRELWVIAGRGAGKDSVASLIAAYSATLFQQHGKLRPGERALVMALACDRAQARIVADYTRALFSGVGALKRLIQRQKSEGFELSNGIDVTVATNSYRSVRGRTLLCAIFDEVAYWLDENSARPDEETLRAVLPGLARCQGSMLIGISTPHSRRGLLYKRFEQYYGKDGDVLVVKAPTRVLNPTIPQAVIDEAIAADPVSRSEWEATWKDDVTQWATRDLVEAAVDWNIVARAPRAGVRYVAFADPSGGRRDSFTLGISHMEGQTVVLDTLVEIMAPFSPDSAVEQLAGVMREYRCCKCYGDAYGNEWVVQSFERRGIRYEAPGYDRTEIYLNFLPLLASARVRLIDHKRTTYQLCTLERVRLPAGRERIDHPRAGHDDCSNSAAGACVLAAAGARFSLNITPAVIAAGRRYMPPNPWGLM